MLTVPSTGSYVVLTLWGTQQGLTLEAGVDYSYSIKTVLSGPYANDGISFQARWTGAQTVPFPYANPAEIPPPSPWV